MKIVVERVKMPQFAFFTDYPESELLQNVPNFFTRRSALATTALIINLVGNIKSFF